PLTRTTAMPDRPGAVDKAQIVSAISLIDSKFEIQDSGYWTNRFESGIPNCSGGVNGYTAAVALTLALCAHTLDAGEGEMHDPPLPGYHRLEAERLAQ
ncbi:MAG: hypothetical protein H6Q07_3228, partial [Acidobacteria bacterium]|nr:hypothetical protein [Acidobacteriota bacterium]